MLLVVAAVAATHTACAADIPAAEAEFFEKHIRPILIERCYECHSEEHKKSKGGLVLDTKAGTQRGGDAGPLIKPGFPDASLLIDAVRYKNQDMQMPPKSPIPAREVALLEEWVKRGAHDPRTDSPAASSGPKGIDIAAGRLHWAFKPLAQVEVPLLPPDIAAQVKTPVDAFILKKLSDSGLPARFSAPADASTLERRLSYTVTGLPPHLTVTAPGGTTSDLIEQLLSSPHYGEHWARHWLDVARYADSNGLDENVALGHAWRYRDYVVNAFNSDKPYDQFVIEQIAGDLLPASDTTSRLEALTATGFLALGAKVLAEPDMEKLKLDIIDEQIDTVGKAFMAMTLGCVRCHDHKFDPIRQDDYYSLAAIFRSTRSLADEKMGAIKYWYEHNLATPEQKASKEELEKKAKERTAALTKLTNESKRKVKEELQAKAADYLAAARELGTDHGIAEQERIAKQHGLRTRYLASARLYLERHPEQPFFKVWWEAKTAAAVMSHYQPLFADKENKEAQAALNDAAGFLAIPDKIADAFDAATVASIESMQAEIMQFETSIQDTPAVMGVTDGEVARSMPVHIRGSYLTLGKPVERGFPEVMRTSLTRTILPVQQSGRLQLARWIASPEHPLTARVIVNRVWRWHFGSGLVTTTDNYGLLGDKPSHPELLDWLAQWFIESGWSFKALHKLLLNSAVYQQSSGLSPESDLENRLLSHFPIRRLTAEEIRDSILAASGSLSLQVGGKTIPQRNREFVFNHTSKDHTTYESPRRALYLPIIRNHLYDILEQFDYPDPTMPTGSRNTTTVAPQALILLNAPVVMQSAGSFAKTLANMLGNDHRITRMYERLYHRSPTAVEVERALAFVRQQSEAGHAEQAWAVLAQTLMAANEFVFLR